MPFLPSRWLFGQEPCAPREHEWRMKKKALYVEMIWLPHEPYHDIPWRTTMAYSHDDSNTILPESLPGRPHRPAPRSGIRVLTPSLMGNLDETSRGARGVHEWCSDQPPIMVDINRIFMVHNQPLNKKHKSEVCPSIMISWLWTMIQYPVRKGWRLIDNPLYLLLLTTNYASTNCHVWLTLVATWLSCHSTGLTYQRQGCLRTNCH